MATNENEACPNMGILYSYDISNLHIWAQKDKDIGTNGACPNMGTLYTDEDISNLHIWAHKGQGQRSSCSEPQIQPLCPYTVWLFR